MKKVYIHTEYGGMVNLSQRNKMILKAKLIHNHQDDKNLRIELNRLYGFETGLVPFEVDATTEHIDAIFTLSRSLNTAFEVEINVDRSGKIEILRLVSES